MGIAEYRDTHPNGAGAIVVIDCLTLYGAVDGTNLLYRSMEHENNHWDLYLGGCLTDGLGMQKPSQQRDFL